MCCVLNTYFSSDKSDLIVKSKNRLKLSLRGLDWLITDWKVNIVACTNKRLSYDLALAIWIWINNFQYNP